MSGLVRRKPPGQAWESLEDSGAGGVTLVQPFTMTAADLKASTLNPQAIVAAQGANTLVVPTLYVWDYTPGDVPFAGTSIDLVYGTQDLNKVFMGLDTLATFAGWSLSAFTAGYAEGGAREDYVNQPVCLRALLRGSIVSADLGVAGSGYAVGDTGTVNDGSPDATYRIDSVANDGVLTFTITDPGGGYILGDGGATSEWETTPGGSQPGGGSGFTVNVHEVDATGSAGDGTMAGAIYYVVAALGG